MTETREVRVKRLKMRAGHRGIKEMDIILGGWAEVHLASADDATLDQFETLLAEADQDLYQWVSGQQTPPAHLAEFIAQVARDFEALRRA